MAAEDRTQAPGMTASLPRSHPFYERLAAEPHAFDFYQALRRIEALHRRFPRIGDAIRPADEPVRLAQEPSLTFAPANLCGFEQRSHGPPRLSSRFLGLFGPQGALPLHLTELARERVRSHSDPTLAGFADLFHHRLLSTFYKAWRQSQPAASHDRPDSDRFTSYVDALYGGLPGDAVQAQARRFYAGRLAHRVRNAGGLEAILSSYFDVPVALDPYHADWLPLSDDQRSALGSGNTKIGRNLVLGKRVRDAQHHFLLRIGPMSMAKYKSLLPDSAGMLRLRDWVRLYTDRQFGWRAQLLLEPDEVLPLRLGRCVRLGWTTWLGMSAARTALEGIRLQAERAAAPLSAPLANAWPKSLITTQEEPCLK